MNLSLVTVLAVVSSDSEVTEQYLKKQQQQRCQWKLKMQQNCRQWLRLLEK